MSNLKVKILSNETNINQWLLEKDSKITIERIIQSGNSDYLAISIWYRDKE